MRVLGVVVLLAVTFLTTTPAHSQTDSVQPYRTTDLRFHSGEVELAGRLFSPLNKETYPVIILVPGSGFKEPTDTLYQVFLAKAFCARGIGVLAYDKRGTGASGGKYTESDFPELGADVSAALRFVRDLPGVTQVAVWGLSQAGWVIPYAVKNSPDIAFQILVSPAGVSPFEQVGFFLERQTRIWGLSEADALKADSMHQAVGLYYATGNGYEDAQKTVDRYRNEPWFKKVITHPYWDEMSPDGRIIEPTALAEAVAKRPGDFQIYRAPSSLMDYDSLYSAMKMRTLIIHGSADELVPIGRSHEVYEHSFQTHPHDLEFKVFDGAEHGVQSADGTVREDYLTFIADWAKTQFDKSR